MRPARWLGAALLALLVVLAASFAVREIRQAQRSVAAERRLASLQGALAGQLRAARQAGRRRAQAAAAGAQRGPADAAPASPAASGSEPPSWIRRAAWFAAHPAARRQYLEAYRAGLTLDWGLLFKTLELSSAQVEGLKELLTQREDDDLTIAAAAAARGVPTSDPAIAAWDDRLDAATKAAIRALVGGTAYAAIHEYMHDQPVVPLVNQLAEAVYDDSNPLDAGQAMALTRALAAASQPKASGGIVEGTIDWTRAQPRVAAILTPAQAAAFAAIQQQDQAAQQVRQLTRSLGAAP